MRHPASMRLFGPWLWVVVGGFSKVVAILVDSLLFSVNNILAGLWLNCISSVEITLFLLTDILL